MLDLLFLEAVAQGVGHRVRRHEYGRRLALGRAEGKLAQKLDLVLRVAGGEKPKRSLGFRGDFVGSRQQRGIGVELADGEFVEEIEQVRGRAEVSVQVVHLVRAAQGLKPIEFCPHEGEDRLLLVAEIDADARGLFVVPEKFDDRELQR